MTTLKSRLVFQYLKKMKQTGVQHVVLEMTSHALDQYRLHGVRLNGAIILNIAREHLDYHRTMEEYAAAKERILDAVIPGGVVVGKGDDERVEQILKNAQRRGFAVQRFSASEAQNTATPLPGAVNKENACAASKLARALGVSDQAIAQGVAAVPFVPGRMERITAPQGFQVIVDYAVTPDALERLYSEARSRTAGKIYGVLGAAGNRDRGKRPDMARAAARYADELVITNEDPWTESPEQIFTDLEAGLGGAPAKWQRIPDRRQALSYCIAKAARGDVIIATGKGAERGMAFGKSVVPWHERTVIEELIADKP